MMADFVALLISGITLGATTALVALGFLLLYRASGVINFAHGDLVTLGTYLAFAFATSAGLPVLLAYVLALVVMFGAGVALERIAHAPLRRRPEIVVGIATLGVGIMIRSALSLWQGSDPKSLPSPVGDSVWRVGGVAISYQRMLIVVVVAVVLAGLYLLLRRTSFGRQVRAMAADPVAAQLHGVRTRRLTMVSFGLSSAMAGLAGILIAPTMAFDLNYGFSVMMLAFAAAILGGFGSLPGVVVAALLLAVGQQLVGGYLIPDYNTVLPFLLLIVGIALRPQGLFTGLSRSRL
jgi:branched-chain amino acid transport system permease protein